MTIKTGTTIIVTNPQSEWHGLEFKVTNPKRTHAYGNKPLIAATHPSHGEQLFHRWEVKAV